MFNSSMVTDHTSLGEGGLSIATTGNPYEPWLGPPNPEALRDMNTYMTRAQSIRTLPEAYKGKNVRLLSFIEEQVFFNSQFLSQVILPIRESDDLNYEWNVWRFNSHLLRPTPYLGVSRYITSDTAGGKKTTTRYGIAFTLEHDFMNTDVGRTNYYYNLRSIANAVNETHNFDILRAIISQNQEGVRFKQRIGFYQDKSFQEIMENEKNMWALLQKDPARGFQTMDSDAVERMKAYGADADVWLVTPKMQYYLQLSEKNTGYKYVGEVGPQRLRNNLSYDSPNAFGEFGQSRVYFVRQFNYDHHQSVDAMARFREIGEYNTLLPIGSVDVNNYTSKDRNVVVYDQDKDDWHLLEFVDIIENCMLFSKHPKNGLSLISPPPFTMDKNAYAVNPFFIPISQSRNDGDGNDGKLEGRNWKPIEVYGQLKLKDFKMKTQLDMAGTIIRNLLRRNRNIENSLSQLMGTVEQLQNKTWGSIENLTDWFSELRGNTNTNTWPSVKPSTERYEKMANFTTMPYNLKTGATISELNVRSNTHLSIGTGCNHPHLPFGFDDTMKSIVEDIERLLPGCLLTDKNRTPGHYPVASQETVFMENVLGITGFPVWINGALPRNAAPVARTDGTPADGRAASISNVLSDILAEFSKVQKKLASAVRVIPPTIDSFLTGAVAAGDGAPANRIQPRDTNKTKIKVMSKILHIAQFFLAAKQNTDILNIYSHEAVQRLNNLSDIFKKINWTTIGNLKSSPNKIIDFFGTLVNGLSVKYVEALASLRKAVDENVARDYDEFPETNVLDETINEWVAGGLEAGFFDYGRSPRETRKAEAQNQMIKIAAARRADEFFVKKGIYPRFGVIGAVSLDFVENNSTVKIFDKIAGTATTGLSEDDFDRTFVRIGGKFGEDDEDEDIEHRVRDEARPVKWFRTSLLLSPVQLVDLYKLQYEDTTKRPINYITVSLPDRPEAPAQPSELANFYQMYKTMKRGDRGSLASSPIAHMLLSPQERIRFISNLQMYKDGPQASLKTQAIDKTNKKRKQGALGYDDDYSIRGSDVAESSERRAKRRRLADRAEFEGGDDAPPPIMNESSSNRTSVPPVKTSDLSSHWETIGKSGQSDLVKAIIRCILFTPFSKESLLSLHENDCLVPVGGLAFTPHMVYLALLAIKVLAGDRLGNMMVGHRSFEIGSNIKTKVFFGHLTLHSAPIIHHPEHIFVAYDIFIKGCYGGAGVTFWNASNRDKYAPLRDERDAASKFAILCSYEEQRNGTLRNPLDASGSFTYYKAEGNVDAAQLTKQHFSTAALYNAIWHFRPDVDKRRGNVPFIQTQHPWHEEPLLRQPHYNTVMWRAAQAHYNNKTGKYDNLNRGTGHWGDIVGPGAKAARSGSTSKAMRFSDIKASLYH